MEFGQKLNTLRENHVISTFQNDIYQFPRRAMKTMVVDSTGHDLVSDTNWSVTFKEPLIIDKLSDIHLDSIITYNAKDNMQDVSNCMGMLLDINEFDINSNTASQGTSVATGKYSETVPTNSNHFNKIFIPNESDDVHKVVIHKGKKINFVATVNPCTLTQLNGSITNLENNTAFENADELSSFTETTTKIHLITGISKVTLVSALPQVVPGFIVTGTDVPANTKVVTVYNNGTIFRVDKNIVDSTNRDLTFTAPTEIPIKGRFIAEFYIIPRD